MKNWKKNKNKIKKNKLKKKKEYDITLPTEVHLVKAMVFPVVMYRCESWTIKKAGPSSQSYAFSSSHVWM